MTPEEMLALQTKAAITLAEQDQEEQDDSDYDDSEDLVTALDLLEECVTLLTAVNQDSTRLSDSASADTYLHFAIARLVRRSRALIDQYDMTGTTT